MAQPTCLIFLIIPLLLFIAAAPNHLPLIQTFHPITSPMRPKVTIPCYQRENSSCQQFDQPVVIKCTNLPISLPIFLQSYPEVSLLPLFSQWLPFPFVKVHLISSMTPSPFCSSTGYSPLVFQQVKLPNIFEHDNNSLIWNPVFHINHHPIFLPSCSQTSSERSLYFLSTLLVPPLSSIHFNLASTYITSLKLPIPRFLTTPLWLTQWTLFRNFLSQQHLILLSCLQKHPLAFLPSLHSSLLISLLLYWEFFKALFKAHLSSLNVGIHQSSFLGLLFFLCYHHQEDDYKNTHIHSNYCPWFGLIQINKYWSSTSII